MVYALQCLTIVFIDFQDGVNDLAQMKVYFSLLFAEWRIRLPKNVIEC